MCQQKIGPHSKAFYRAIFHNDASASVRDPFLARYHQETAPPIAVPMGVSQFDIRKSFVLNLN